MKPIRVLAVGNSFSRNAMLHLHQIAAADGCDLTAVNLFIGGCSLERHMENVRADVRAYSIQRNGTETHEASSIRETLADGPWDFVTMQQCSGLSGIAQSYYPYLTELSAYIQSLAPEARRLIHETWAYESDASHAQFVNYGRDQRRMYEALRDAYRRAGAETGAPLIPVGDVIQALRERVPFFDYAHGGAALTADGFHLTPDYGCFAAGLTWYAFLTGADPEANPYSPALNCDPAALAAIRKTVREVLGGRRA